MVPDDTVQLIHIPRMPGILTYVERPALSPQQATLGEPDQDPVGSLQPPP